MGLKTPYRGIFEEGIMNATLCIDFRAEDQPLNRVYTVYIPVLLASTDGGVSTEDGVIKATTIEGMTIIYDEEDKDVEHR